MGNIAAYAEGTETSVQSLAGTRRADLLDMGI
jgi:hypothetical protein